MPIARYPSINAAGASLTKLDLRARHSLGFILCCALLLLAKLVGFEPNPLDWPFVTAVLILSLGVPHGAFDISLARDRGLYTGKTGLALFLASYISYAAVMIIGFVLAPRFALPAFIAISAWHFGGDWRGKLNWASRAVVGGAIITSPTVFFQNEVIQIFDWIAPTAVAQSTAGFMRLVCFPLLFASAIIVFNLSVRSLTAGGEIATILLVSLFLPPLAFFLLYFCGFHSVRHFCEVAEELRVRSADRFLWECFPYAPIAIAGTLAGALAFGELGFGKAALGAVFVSLAALTVPHMLLVDERRAGRRQAAESGAQKQRV